MKRFSGLAVPLATFLFSAVLAFAVNPAMGLLGLLAAGGTTGQKPCEIKVFRDDPYFTKELIDWPLSGNCPRSPMFVFGKDRPITIEVKIPGTSHAKVVVQVTNKDLAAPGPKTIDIECDHMGDGVYRSRITGKDEILYLADRTEERADGDLLHVREEEVLEFVLKDPADSGCKFDVMVDRGEGAATTVEEQDSDEMRRGFEGAANLFMDGIRGFDPDTTNWWDVGRALSSADFPTFVLNAGADDTNDATQKNWESDILFLGAHGNPAGNLLSAPKAKEFKTVFGPDKAMFYRKPGEPDGSKPREQPNRFYVDNGGNVTTFGANGKHWDTDIDWAMFYSCSTLTDIAYDVGKTIFPDKKPPKFVLDPAPNSTTRARDRWKNAFSGARRLHGILGYTTLGSGSRTVLTVIPHWTKLVKDGVTTIPEAWVTAVAEKDPKTGAAILYIPRNWADTIDTMQRDPCAGEVPSYWASGMKLPAPKKETPPKPLIKGKVPATGRAMTETVPQGEIEVPLETKPKSTLLGGQARVFTSFPKAGGRHPRLRLTRSETLAQGSLFSLDAEGVYRFRSGVPFGEVVPNAVTPEAADAGLRAFLSAHFTDVPALATYEVFEGVGWVLDGLAAPVDNRFEILLEQRHKNLPIFDSGVYAALNPFGAVESASVVYYDVVPAGTPTDLLTANQAAEIAALDFLSRFPGRPCDLTLIVPFYGEPTDLGAGLREVRPVWSIQFSKGEFVTTLDAVTGAILRTEGE